MDWDQFDLFYGPTRVGVVILVDVNVPNLPGNILYDIEIDSPELTGNIIYDPSLSAPQSTAVARLSRYVDLARRSAHLLYKWDRSKPSPELDAMEAELAANYRDFIDSEDWHLVDRSGRELPIPRPSLQGDDEIVWSWNLGEG